jgi:hypothetical protein
MPKYETQRSKLRENVADKTVQTIELLYPDLFKGLNLLLRILIHKLPAVLPLN